ncbi:hypothetical protein MtrunA17_Chr3g0126621 [Medicago truncatula]|uniref:Uncharacterized protein n=1 Tax=Medicago truncatula TaxID=3880 RepID=A0A396IVM9_MEDTR|nr:hypothetical protein MtrunA17_Chr3g0126621 [Medicago truncatula]
MDYRFRIGRVEIIGVVLHYDDLPVMICFSVHFYDLQNKSSVGVISLIKHDKMSLAAISQVLLDITQEMSVIGLMSDEIMENILCNLPIKEAFEASVLPKR